MLNEIHTSLQQVIDNAPDENERTTQANVSQLAERMAQARKQMDALAVQSELRIADLQQSSSIFGRDYHWIVFVLLYGGVFLIQ